MASDKMHVDRRNDGEDIQYIKRTLNRWIEAHGTDGAAQIIRGIQQYLETAPSDIPLLTPADVERAVEREFKIKDYNEAEHDKPTVGRPNKVEHYVNLYLDDEGARYRARTTYEARKNLSRSSFYRYRKRIEDEIGHDPVVEHEGVLIFKTEKTTGPLGSSKS